MNRKQIRARLHPFRLLVMLLYGTYGWLSREGSKITATTSGLVKLLRVSRSRLDDYFGWLEQMGYLKEVTRTRGKVQAQLVYPTKPEEKQNAKDSFNPPSAPVS